MAQAGLKFVRLVRSTLADSWDYRSVPPEPDETILFEVEKNYIIGEAR